MRPGLKSAEVQGHLDHVGNLVPPVPTGLLQDEIRRHLHAVDRQWGGAPAPVFLLRQQYQSRGGAPQPAQTFSVGAGKDQVQGIFNVRDDLRAPVTVLLLCPVPPGGEATRALPAVARGFPLPIAPAPFFVLRDGCAGNRFYRRPAPRAGERRDRPSVRDGELAFPENGRRGRPTAQARLSPACVTQVTAGPATFVWVPQRCRRVA